MDGTCFPCLFFFFFFFPSFYFYLFFVVLFSFVSLMSLSFVSFLSLSDIHKHTHTHTHTHMYTHSLILVLSLLLRTLTSFSWFGIASHNWFCFHWVCLRACQHVQLVNCLNSCDSFLSVLSLHTHTQVITHQHPLCCTAMLRTELTVLSTAGVAEPPCNWTYCPSSCLWVCAWITCSFVLESLAALCLSFQVVVAVMSQLSSIGHLYRPCCSP